MIASIQLDIGIVVDDAEPAAGNVAQDGVEAIVQRRIVYGGIPYLRFDILPLHPFRVLPDQLHAVRMEIKAQDFPAFFG